MTHVLGTKVTPENLSLIQIDIERYGLDIESDYLEKFFAEAQELGNDIYAVFTRDYRSNTTGFNVWWAVEFSKTWRSVGLTHGYLYQELELI